MGKVDYSHEVAADEGRVEVWCGSLVAWGQVEDRGGGDTWVGRCNRRLEDEEEGGRDKLPSRRVLQRLFEKGANWQREWRSGKEGRRGWNEQGGGWSRSS